MRDDVPPSAPDNRRRRPRRYIEARRVGRTHEVTTTPTQRRAIAARWDALLEAKGEPDVAALGAVYAELTTTVTF